MATSQQKRSRFEGTAAIFAVVGLVLLLGNDCFALDPRQSLGRCRLVCWDEDQGLPENYTSNIAQTKDGFIWLAYDHGLIRFDGRNFATGEDLRTNIEPPGKVFGLVPGPTGELWIGSYRALYCRLADGEFQRFDNRNGLPDDYLNTLCLDHEGTLWIGTDSHGLFQLQFNSLPPSVQIERLVVDLTEVQPVRPGRQSPELPAGIHSLEIDYAGLSFSAPEKVRFRYKLEGFDRDWIDAGGRREAYYTNLAPGIYQFRVIACNNDGVWLAEKSAAVTAFVIRPHFYQTVWFGAICAGAVIAAVWLLWRWRLQQILEERTRLARELHDTAARGIVALVWQLEGVKSIAKRGNFDALVGNLDEASRLARESLRETRRAVRALRSEVFDSDCSLASALQKALQVAAKGTGLRTELKVSGTPYLTTRTLDQALLRIAQESFTNTLKYAQAKRFRTELCYSPGQIRLQLCDDGIGFDYQSSSKNCSAQETWISGGLGLVGIKERVRQLGGEIQVKSSPNRGTTIQVVIPRQPRIWRWLAGIMQ